jgi:hypothetical protein
VASVMVLSPYIAFVWNIGTVWSFTSTARPEDASVTHSYSPKALAPWISDLLHISAWDRRRPQGARPQEYSAYFKVAQRSERRRDRVEICGRSLVQGTSAWALWPSLPRELAVRTIRPDLRA